VAQTELLGQVAAATLHHEDQAGTLFDLNTDQLKLPDAWPAGADLHVPQRDLPGVLTFAALVLVLTLVGLGRWLNPPGGAASEPKI
jgi:hypothetical protein